MKIILVDPNLVRIFFILIIVRTFEINFFFGAH